MQYFIRTMDVCKERQAPHNLDLRVPFAAFLNIHPTIFRQLVTRTLKNI